MDSPHGLSNHLDDPPSDSCAEAGTRESQDLLRKSFSTKAEQAVAKEVESIFNSSSSSVATKIENFPRYARRKTLTRFLALYEIFKLAQCIKGSVVECGVWEGFGLMSWAKFSSILEPTNLTRRIYGFDTFAGFPSVAPEDRNAAAAAEAGDFATSSYEELLELIRLFDADRYLGQIDKVSLVRGDATVTIPKFVAENPHLVISLLYLDFDLYEPSRAAIEHLVPRMPKGAIIAFDELDNPVWPGETRALLDTIGIKRLGLRRLEWDPYISFAIID